MRVLPRCHVSSWRRRCAAGRFGGGRIEALVVSAVIACGFWDVLAVGFRLLAAWVTLGKVV